MHIGSNLNPAVNMLEGELIRALAAREAIQKNILAAMEQAADVDKAVAEYRRAILLLQDASHTEAS